MQSSLNIALVGASGAVGTEFLKLFELIELLSPQKH